MHLAGFEPTAFRLGGGRSILLSYRNIACFIYNFNKTAFFIICIPKPFVNPFPVSV